MEYQEQVSDFRLTLDQALLWVATRNVQFVNEASERDWSGCRRRTWMSTRVEVACDSEASPFLMPPSDAEHSLWSALCKGMIQGTLDGEALPIWWYASARLQNATPDKMVFVRRREKPIVLATHADGTSLASGVETEEPRFDTAEMLAAFPRSPDAELAQIDEEKRDNADALERVVLRSGLVGRPTSMHLLVPEARRRAASGNFPDKQKLFFEQLSEWLKSTYPNAPSAKVSAMKMNAELCEIHRSAKAARDEIRSKNRTR
jgi:hypothetical protein